MQESYSPSLCAHHPAQTGAQLSRSQRKQPLASWPLTPRVLQSDLIGPQFSNLKIAIIPCSSPQCPQCSPVQSCPISTHHPPVHEDSDALWLGASYPRGLALHIGLHFLLLTHLQSGAEAISYEYACGIMRAWGWGRTWGEEFTRRHPPALPIHSPPPRLPSLPKGAREFGAKTEVTIIIVPPATIFKSLNTPGTLLRASPVRCF